MKDSMSPAEIGERAGKVRSAVLRMTQLIENLLNSSRLIDGGVGGGGGGGEYFHPAEMDMAALLQEVCQLHREMVPGAHIAERVVAAPMPMVGDAKLLFQVFSNVLSNAIKYSPDGGVKLSPVFQSINRGRSMPAVMNPLIPGGSDARQ